MGDDTKGLLTSWGRGDFLPSHSVPTEYLTQLRDRADGHFEMVVMLNSQNISAQAVFFRKQSFFDFAVGSQEKKELIAIICSWPLFGR